MPSARQASYSVCFPSSGCMPRALFSHLFFVNPFHCDRTHSTGAALAVMLSKAGLYAHYTEVEAPLLEALALADAASCTPASPPLVPHAGASSPTQSLKQQQWEKQGKAGASNQGPHQHPQQACALQCKGRHAPVASAVQEARPPLGLVLATQHLDGT
eukprot:scaffold221101_cov19-Tisochrysis_lutea.AAC.2